MEDRELEIKDKGLFIINDLLSEIQDGKSNRPKGMGITTDEYIETQLMHLADLLNGYRPIEYSLEQLTNQKNNISRKIATLKKALPKKELKETCVNCGIEISLQQHPFCSDKCQDEAHETN